MVFLTFDDGFSSVGTILDCLRQNNVQCTFFIKGSCLSNSPDLWRQAIKDGHEICYHTMEHSDLTAFTNQQILDDIKIWNATAKKVLGNDYIIPKLARFPTGSGNKDQRVLNIFNNLNYKVISWNMDTLSGVSNYKTATGQEIANYILNKVTVGSISLQHFNAYDSKSIPFYIETLKQKYKLGKLSDAISGSK